MSAIQTKILILVSFLSVVTLGLSLLVTLWLLNRSVHQSSISSLARTGQLAQTLLESHRTRLSSEVQLIGALPILRAAVETNDTNTIVDTASELQSKLGLPIFNVLDRQGKLLTGGPAYDRSLALRVAGGKPETSLIRSGDNLFLIAAGPISTSGILEVGVPLDRQFEGHIQELTEMEISFIAGQDDAHSKAAGDSGDSFSRVVPLTAFSGQTIGQLQIVGSLAESTKIKREILLRVLALGAIILVFAVLFGVWFSRTLSKPIVELSELAAQILETGDLSMRAKERGPKEVMLLAKSLNHFLSRIQENQLALQRSLTELRTTQEQLMQSNKLSALGEMAGGIAHEINNPLAIIQTLSEQVGESLQDQELDRKHLSELSEKIRDTVFRIARIVQGLRLISRDASRDPLVVTDVRGVIEQTLAVCREKFKSYGISIEVKSITSCAVYCRSTQLSQVLLNLLNNSFDAIENLPEKWIEIECKELGAEIELSVTDSGNGVKGPALDKLFQPFFTTKDVGKGTGLGLSVSRSLVEAHGGKLTLDVTGPHTRFVISLPKGPAQ